MTLAIAVTKRLGSGFMLDVALSVTVCPLSPPEVMPVSVIILAPSVGRIGVCMGIASSVGVLFPAMVLAVITFDAPLLPAVFRARTR